MKSKDDLLKIRATVLYILNKFPEGVDYIKLFKIIYFAQQRHLSTYGRVIINETFRAKKHGPVPSFSYNTFLELEKNNYTKDSADFVSGITIKDKKVFSEIKPDMDELSVSDIKCLDYSFEKCKNKRSYPLSERSHDEAWKSACERRILDPENDRMTVLEIAKAGKSTLGMLGYIRDTQIINQSLKSGF